MGGSNASHVRQKTFECLGEDLLYDVRVLD